MLEVNPVKPLKNEPVKELRSMWLDGVSNKKGIFDSLVRWMVFCFIAWLALARFSEQWSSLFFQVGVALALIVLFLRQEGWNEKQ